MVGEDGVVFVEQCELERERRRCGDEERKGRRRDGMFVVFGCMV